MPKQHHIAELEARIHILELENKQLTDQVEDSMMLGLVAEAIEQSQSIENAINIALERISMLKNLPLALCCTFERRQVP